MHSAERACRATLEPLLCATSCHLRVRRTLDRCWAAPVSSPYLHLPIGARLLYSASPLLCSAVLCSAAGERSPLLTQRTRSNANATRSTTRAPHAPATGLPRLLPTDSRHCSAFHSSLTTVRCCFATRTSQVLTLRTCFAIYSWKMHAIGRERMWQ